MAGVFRRLGARCEGGRFDQRPARGLKGEQSVSAKGIVYWYRTNVAGLDAAGEQIGGRVSRAEEPRTVRLGIKYHF